MATITTWNDGDSGSTVQDLVNANFAALNADKIEAADVKTLTNKTIDADSNTISNLETDNIKSTAKTGSDTRVVTGTDGTANNVIMWNADGDAIDSGVAFSTDTTLGGASPSNAKAPTEQAVKTYVDGQVNGHDFFPVTYGTGTSALSYGNWGTAYGMNSVSDKIFIPFHIQSNFGTLSTAKVRVTNIHTTATEFTFTFDTEYGASGENTTTHSENITGQLSGNLSQGETVDLDVSQVLSNLTAGDAGMLAITITASTSATYQCIATGLSIEY